MTADSTRRDAYQFGDTNVAAERLRLLADVFGHASRQFLERFAALGPQRVLDLGCGPGYTTRLLAEIFSKAQVVGVDSSPNFIELARRAPSERVSFIVGDVTDPLGGGTFDFLYCRYLLTHIAHVGPTIELWARYLRPGGLLAIEENDWIRTSEPAFAKYLHIVEAMLADAGQRLYVGADLDRMSWPSLARQSSEVAPISVTDRAAAAMFVPNLATWRDRPFVRSSYSAEELDTLRRDLERLAHDESPHSSITFGRRLLVFMRNSE
jgi:SAM-dependent methyltransferase